MGAKSTQRLTRDQAEKTYVEKYKELHQLTWERQARAAAVVLDDTQLENEIERMADEVADHGSSQKLGGSYNYLIVPEGSEDV